MSNNKKRTHNLSHSLENINSETLTISNSYHQNIGNFILGEKLGEGTFGLVRLGTHVLTGEKVAVKILEKSKIIEDSDKNRIEKEIKILKNLRHPNIIQLYCVIQTYTSIYLIMEYANEKELFDYIVKNKKLSEIESCKFFQQLISGIEYLNKIGIVHRDLKPENILLDSKKKTLKIVDFGLSNTYKKNQLLKTSCGSPCYAAPEMINGEFYKGINIDIWSSGIILFAMLCGFLPFEDEDTEILYKKIIKGNFTIPKFISNQGKDLIKKILTVDPNKRISINEIKCHPWFNLFDGKNNLYEGLLISNFVIPIDDKIVNDMISFGFSKEDIIKNILQNKHNHITTTYYLMVKIKIKNNEICVSNLESKEFENFIKNKKNTMENFNNDNNQVINFYFKKYGIKKKKNNINIFNNSNFNISNSISNNNYNNINLNMSNNSNNNNLNKNNNFNIINNFKKGFKENWKIENKCKINDEKENNNINNENFKIKINEYCNSKIIEKNIISEKRKNESLRSYDFNKINQKIKKMITPLNEKQTKNEFQLLKKEKRFKHFCLTSKNSQEIYSIKSVTRSNSIILTKEKIKNFYKNGQELFKNKIRVNNNNNRTFTDYINKINGTIDEKNNILILNEKKKIKTENNINQTEKKKKKKYN